MLLPIHLPQPLHFPLELCGDGVGGEDEDIFPEGEDPAEEVVAHGNVHAGLGPAGAGCRVDGDVAVEAVEHNADHVVFEGELDFGFVAAEHVEAHFGVFGEVKLLEEVAADALVLQDADALHLVDPQKPQALIPAFMLLSSVHYHEQSLLFIQFIKRNRWIYFLAICFHPFRNSTQEITLDNIPYLFIGESTLIQVG